MVFDSVHSLTCMFIAWHFKTASFTRKRKRNILVHNCQCVPYSSRVSFIGEEEEKEEERKKKENYFQNSFSYSFYKTWKSRNICTQEGQGFL